MGPREGKNLPRDTQLSRGRAGACVQLGSALAPKPGVLATAMCYRPGASITLHNLPKDLLETCC